MSKRRSSIKRQSRHSSAILNSNWDSFDDEHSHWWKNLEDNTLTRLSTNSNVLNQTSRYLNSDSQMETSSSMDNWWKVLETSSNSSKINNHVIERDSLRNVQTSDSEEGSIVKKRKHPLLLKEKKSKDNIFLNALNDSESSKLEVAEKTRQSSQRRRSSASTSKTNPNAQQSNRVEERSLDHSQSSNDILKSRPDIFRRNYKSRNNAFVDVLKKSELEFSLKGKSKTVSDNEQQIERNDSMPAASKASTPNEAVANQSELTSESKNDVSHSRTPKAQTIIFENNNPSVHNSTKSDESNDSTDSEYDIILKPKTRLLANYRKSADKNPFENIIDNQEDTAKVQENSLQASPLPLRSPSKERISTGSAQSMPTVVGTSTSQNTNISKGQKSIRDFLRSDEMLPVSQVFRDKDKVNGIKRELERLKKREIARINDKQKNEKKSSLEAGKIEKVEEGRKLQKQRSTRQIHKAFLVNGKPYRAPRLPRPQYWITDRLYKYLWKCMEPRFKLETRVASEKFVHQLSNVTTLIVKRKSYSNYKAELHALMKEMARLGIIRTRNDFYNFCHDYFPYELRAKTVPMLLPGNKSNIPYDADKLHEPLLAS
ncbi:uncharacterized protein LOC122534480 [Frieseomelitta varia]|uniref:uncharacterized protein LOC122534480 n=1 Tax=Frieseomelitta varia TaxID=561572 RepID=UPI001CB68845|nr:uncharacterized protein LOC122534480 [Frieseomelitta varia]